jgi:hypothetical protein
MTTLDEEMNELESKFDVRGVGLAWYSAEAWRQLQSIPEAGVEMSYAEYCRKLEKIERDFVARGTKFKRVPIDVDGLVAWCRRNGYEINSTSSATYAGMLAMGQNDPSVRDKPITNNVTRKIQ